MRKIGSLTNTADNNGEFTNGNVAAGKKPTIFYAEWFNTVQRELVAIVENSGLNLDVNDDEQISKIIDKMASVIRHYRNYGYPLWEQGITYYFGAVVYHSDGLYLSLNKNNLGNVPGTDDSVWQPYIQRESTKQEAVLGEGSTQVITPRRLHEGASYLDEKLKTALTPYLLPVGAIIMWPSTIPPDGWLELNGQEFDTTENPKLATMFPGAQVPDYRGRFARGWANGSLVDPDSNRKINSLQDDALQEIQGEFVVDDWGWVDGKLFREIGALSSGWTSQGGGKAVEFKAGNVARTSTETRPSNVATMFIIKTDKADSTPGVPVPSAIVVTPSPSTVKAGSSVQFSGQVLPSNFAPDYPVSWSVSDTTLGTIDSTGRYTSIAGKTGSQTVIASISTGLTTLITFEQHIYLSSISIAAIPNIQVDGVYNLAVTFNPDDYTEPVNYASSDAQIASVIGGVVTGVGAGTVTISVAGRYSGITASRQVTITSKIIVEEYLQINENLSEIAEKGVAAQAEARANLGLKALATKDGLTASDVGAVPQASVSLGTENLNTVVALGRKFQSLTSNATLARNYPEEIAGAIDVIKTTVTGIRQIYYPYNSTDVYHRYCVDVTAATPVFSNWTMK